MQAMVKMIFYAQETCQIGGVMTYEEIVDKAREVFLKNDVSGLDEHLAFQFNITGEGEGVFYMELKEGKLYVEPYEYYDRDAAFTCSAKTLFKIAEGHLDPILAFTLGKIKVDGSIDQALKLGKFVQSQKRR